jgi:hypothetical protein
MATLKEQAQEEGCKAYRKGLSCTCNPYNPTIKKYLRCGKPELTSNPAYNRDFAIAWRAGWEHARYVEEIAEWNGI